MNKKIKFNENEMLLNNIKISFKYTIQEAIELSEKVIVQLNMPTGIDLGYDELNNVFCYDYRGNKVWQIKPQTLVGREKMDPMPYELIYANNNEELFATDFMGRRFKVDIKSGEIIDFSIAK